MSHDCSVDDPVARVLVDGTQIPVINDGVRTEVRKDSPMDITRYSEVRFPARWNGTDYSSVVQALDPDQANVYDPVDVQLRDAVSGEYVTVHRGFVMGVGGSAEGSIERRMTIGDVGQLLGAVPFNGTYAADAALDDIIDDVLEALNARIAPQVFDKVTVANRAPDIAVGGEPPDVEDAALALNPQKTIGYEPGTSIEFASNEHEALDALAEVSDFLPDDTVMSFEPRGERSIELVIDSDPHRRYFARHVSEFTGDVDVLQNNALHEIRPLNTLTVTGRIFNGPEYQKYPYASAVHEPLSNRAGAVLEQVDGPVDAKTIEGVKRKAKAKLKERLDDSGLGQIITKPAPMLRPYTELTAQPACGDSVSEGETPLTFEVQSVIHRAAARADTDGARPKRRHETQVKASIAIREEDILTPDQEAGYKREGESSILGEILVGPEGSQYTKDELLPEGSNAGGGQ